MLGWLAVLWPVWDSWAAPAGRWSSQAFPILDPKPALYVVEGRRLWRLEKGTWQEKAAFPEEVRAGLAAGADTLLLGGLNVLYWHTPQGTRRIPLAGAGWVDRLWQGPDGIAIRTVQGSYWLRWQGDSLHLTRIAGEWMGTFPPKLLLRKGDTLYAWPGEKPLLRLPARRWLEAFPVRDQLWGLTEAGQALPLPGGSPLAVGARWVCGPYLLSEKAILRWPEASPLWTSATPIYSAAFSAQHALLAVITAAECHLLYLEAPYRWVRRWPLPMTQGTFQEGQWVLWQGETALTPQGLRRYPATLLEAALYQGQWVWATPAGLLRSDGTPLAEPGRYIHAVAATGTRLAWSSGTQLTLRHSSREARFHFRTPIRRLAWQGSRLWAWSGDYLYLYEKERWQPIRLAFRPEEAQFWREAWYLRLGSRWLVWKNGQVQDTLTWAPWMGPPLPLPFGWGRPLVAFSQGDTLHLLTSLGHLAYLKAGRLPPLTLRATLQGPALKPVAPRRFELPAERPYIELAWEADALFLPGLLRVRYQIGADPPQPLDQPRLLLALSQPGTVTLRLWVEHPAYPKATPLEWTVEVIPPWYQTWFARALLIVGLVGIVAGIAFLREWNLRRLQRKLTAEREALLKQTQAQQTQLLRAERMANLGLMAAHIAHEINTPLGVIQSSLQEAQNELAQQAKDLPLPSEPRPAPARLRELRHAWQAAHPELPPLLLQQLAALGYTPDQHAKLAPWLADPLTWENLRRTVALHQALYRAHEAAQKLHERVQAIRTYVRGMQEEPTQLVNLSESVRATLAFYQPLMRGVQVHLSAPPHPVYVEASPARLEQVWANLIQNALQAMPDGGQLRVWIEDTPTEVHVRMEDTGKGIPAPLRQAIFEPLFTTKAPGEGTGLGLPLCRQIVESYGGRLELLHSEPGYTAFRVRLPKSPKK